MAKRADCVNCDGVGIVDDNTCPVCNGLSPVMDTCSNCNHTGLVTGTCPVCLGTKSVSAGGSIGKIIRMVEPSITKCPTYVLLEATDTTEYANLDANKKAWYNLYISAGTINMTEGTTAYDLFLSWIFPSGTSHNAIIASLAAL